MSLNPADNPVRITRGRSVGSAYPTPADLPPMPPGYLRRSIGLRAGFVQDDGSYSLDWEVCDERIPLDRWEK